MYSIGNIILGTYLPWSDEAYYKLQQAYIADDPVAFVQEGETIEELMETAGHDDIELFDALEGIGKGEWNKEYHGSGDSPVAWLGVRVGEIDDTDHFSLHDIAPSNFIGPGKQEVWDKAIAAYNELPQTVKDVLPPFGIYVVWSSS